MSRIGPFFELALPAAFADSYVNLITRMLYTVHLQKYLDFHSEGSSIERYILKKETSLPFRPTIGLEVLQPDSFGYTCRRVIWRSAQDDYVVWDESEVIKFDPLVVHYPTIQDGLQVYLNAGWGKAEKIPEREP